MHNLSFNIEGELKIQLNKERIIKMPKKNVNNQVIGLYKKLNVTRNLNISSLKRQTWKLIGIMKNKFQDD